MNALTPFVESVARALLPMARDMLLDEMRREAHAKLRRRGPEKAEREIAEACKLVAIATDRLAQAQFVGRSEIPARRALERACKRLSIVMHKHGRMPEGER